MNRWDSEEDWGENQASGDRERDFQSRGDDSSVKSECQVDLLAAPTSGSCTQISAFWEACIVQGRDGQGLLFFFFMQCILSECQASGRKLGAFIMVDKSSVLILCIFAT